MRNRGRGIGRSDSIAVGGSATPTPPSNNAVIIDGSSMGFVMQAPADTNESAITTFNLTAGAGLPVNLTMGMWVKPQAGMPYDTWSYFMTLDRTSPWTQFLGFGINANGVERYRTFIDICNNVIHGAGALAIDTWSHVCLRKTGFVYNIIVNSIALVLDPNDGGGSTTQRTNGNTADNLRKLWINQLGASGQEAALVFDGSLCGAFYITESLSLEDIAAIAASTDPVEDAQVSCRLDGHTDLTNEGTNGIDLTAFGTLTTDTEGPY